MNTLLRERTRRFVRRLRRKTGYSLTEALLATLLVAILSLGIATGIAFAGRQYRNAMIRAEKKVLCSTLTEIISGELRNTSTIWATPSGDFDSFHSRGFAQEGSERNRFYSVRLDENMNILSADTNDFGQLLIGYEDADGEVVGSLLLSSASYTTYHLTAKVGIDYDEDDKLFHVQLSIRLPDGDIDVNEFDVIPLYDLEYEE